MTAPALGVVWRAKLSARLKLSVPPDIGFELTPRVIHQAGTLGLSLAPDFQFTPVAKSTGTFALSVPPQFLYVPPNKGLGAIALTVPPGFSFGDIEVRQPAVVAVSVPPSFGFDDIELRTGFDYPLPFRADGGTLITATLLNADETAVNNLAAGTTPMPEAVTATSSTTVTLSNTYSLYRYTGSTSAVWTLPTASSNTGMAVRVINTGTGLLTVQRSGTDQIQVPTGIALSLPFATGATGLFMSDGTYWLTGE